MIVRTILVLFGLVFYVKGQVYQESDCANAGGRCVESACCSGTLKSRLCPTQRAGVKCCLGSNTCGSSCPLVNYYQSGTRYYGLSDPQRIDGDFRSDMNDMNNFAISCNVKIRLTSVFRADPASNDFNGGTYASKSNHMIGHAIDLNLLDVATNKFCNGACLRGYNGGGANDGIKCFVNKIKGHSVLHWGISFNDPVHFDDRLNIRSPTSWDRKRAQILNNCRL